MGADERAGIGAVEVAGAILAAMTGLAGPAPLGVVARAAGMSPAKVHRYLVSLVRTGLVAQDRMTQRYLLGPAALALGMAALLGMDAVRMGGEVLEALRDATDETSLLAVWGAGGPVIVRLEESARPVFMNIRVGSVLPVGSSAVGLVFAAHLPPDTWTGLGKVDPAMVIKVREEGVGAVDGALVPGVAAVAAPVFDHRGRVVAAIGLLGRAGELAGLRETLRAAARDLSHRLGCAPTA